jgi:type IV pilus assembly protein PilB
MVARESSIVEIKKTARMQGFRDIHYDGMKKVLRGLTTIDELERVTTAAE